MRAFSFRTIGINIKRTLYEGVGVPAALSGAETWCMAEAENKKFNVVEMRCLRSMCGVTRMDQVRNEEVQRRTGVIKELIG